MGFKKIFLGLAIALSFSFIANVFNPQVVEAVCPWGQFANNDASGGQSCQPIPNSSDVMGQLDNQDDGMVNYIYRFAAALSWISVGLAAITIVYAAYKYTLSQADPKAIEEAKVLLFGAFVGLLISMSSFLILGLINTIALT